MATTKRTVEVELSTTGLGPDGKPRRFAFIGHSDKGGQYWEGE